MAQLPHDHGHHDLGKHMPHNEDFLVVSDIFKQLADPTRIRLFWLLCHCEACVTNLSAMMQMSSPALSHHLRLLKDAGLIVSHRCGKEVHYQAAETPEARALHDAMEGLMAIACPTELHK